MKFWVPLIFFFRFFRFSKNRCSFTSKELWKKITGSFCRMPLIYFWHKKIFSSLENFQARKLQRPKLSLYFNYPQLILNFTLDIWIGHFLVSFEKQLYFPSIQTYEYCIEISPTQIFFENLLFSSKKISLKDTFLTNNYHNHGMAWLFIH